MTEVGEGILCVTTASHGGYYVPDHLLERITPERRRAAAQWSGSENWYEEDFSWAYVATAFPELFPEEAVINACLLIARMADWSIR